MSGHLKTHYFFKKKNYFLALKKIGPEKNSTSVQCCFPPSPTQTCYKCWIEFISNNLVVPRFSNGNSVTDFFILDNKIRVTLVIIKNDKNLRLKEIIHTRVI